MPTPTRFKRLLSKLALILFGLLSGAILMEIGLRVVGYSYPEFYQPDIVRGYALRPNMEGWYRKEGAAYIRINSDGLRDREHPKAKPANTIRIAVIGDSYPEALPVTQEEAFWSLLEKRLNACLAFGDKQVEVLNFGVSGYSTAQELLTLREQVWQYGPDIVMLTVTTNNDISDNVLALKKTDEVPYFVLREGRLSLDDSFKNTRAFRWRVSALNRFSRWVRDHSRVLQAIIQGHHGFKIWLAARRAKKAQSEQAAGNQPTAQTQALPGPAEELGTDNVIYREPTEQVWNDAWAITEALIVEMNNEVRGKGAKFIVVTLSNGIQVVPDAQARAAFLKRVGASDVFYPDRRITLLCQRNGIPAIMLAPDLQRYADQNRVFLHGFGANIGNGHWNQLGHRVAAELLADRMCPQSVPNRIP